MAVLDLNLMAEGIASTLRAALDTARINVYAHPEGIREAPYILVRPADPFVRYQRTFGAAGIAEVRFELLLNAGVPSGAGDSYRLMYEMCGQGAGTTLSVFDALGADPTLGGMVQTSSALDVGRPVLAEDTGELIALFPITLQHKRG